MRHVVLLRPGAGPEGQPVRQGDRGTARGLEGRSAEGRGRRSGTGSPPSTRPAAGDAPRALRLVRRQRALREGRPLRRSGVSVHGVQHRLAQADRLARAVGLDMVEAGWRPTVDNYLGRVTKPRILEAVREAKGEQSAQLIDHLKKARHGEGGRTAARRHRLAARAAAHSRKPRPPSQSTVIPPETMTRCPNSSPTTTRRRDDEADEPAVIAAE